jgi:hypothetical protein
MILLRWYFVTWHSRDVPSFGSGILEYPVVFSFHLQALIKSHVDRRLETAVFDESLLGLMMYLYFLHSP